MEIQALLTAPTAKTAPVKGAVPGGADEFAASLKDAQTALEQADASPPPEGGIPTGQVAGNGEVAETEPIAPPPSLDPVPNPTANPALLNAGLVNVAAAVVAVPAAPAAPAATSPTVVPIAIAAPAVAETGAAQATTKTDGKLPEAPIPTEISVKVFDVEPNPAPEVVAVVIGGADSLPADAEGEPADDSSDSSSDAKAEAPRIEPKGEVRTDTTARVDTPAKAEATRPEVRLDTHNVVRELANRIELMAAAKSPQGVEIHLQPLDLGSITLLVKPESGGVSTQISASNDHVRQALEQSQPALTRQLELRGVQVASVSVSAETSNHNPQRQPSSSPQQGFESRSFHQSASPRNAAYASPDPVARRVRTTAAGVDLWI